MTVDHSEKDEFYQFIEEYNGGMKSMYNLGVKHGRVECAIITGILACSIFLFHLIWRS